MSLTKAELAERAEAIARLHSYLKPGSTVRTSVLHVSRSGMQREIECLCVDPADHEIVNISWLVARAIGARVGKTGGVVMGGCGMDMCFQTVYLLGCYMWPNGTPTPHGTRNRESDSNGGYALRYRSR